MTAWRALSAHDLALALGAAAALPMALGLGRSWRRWHAARTARRVARHMAASHQAALTRRRAQLVQTDAYGKPMLAKWHHEIDYFLDSQVAPALRPRARAALERERARLRGEIDAMAEQNDAATPAPDQGMSPAAFEAFCREQLQRAGWQAWLTASGPDQGADIVAERGLFRVVVQCKLHARPVGNKAVQEVTAARAHQRATHAAVVSNRPYTPAAQQLAAANAVLLLHYGELRDLEDRLTASR